MNFWRIANRVRRRTILASVTLASYRTVLNGIGRPKFDEELVHRTPYSMLAKMADDDDWSKKTYDNAADHLDRVGAGGAGIGGRDDKARRRRVLRDVEGEF